MLRSSFTVLVLGALACACDKPRADPAPAPPAPVATAPAAPPAAPAPVPVAVAPSGKMAHCPSAVTGAATKIEDTADGVAITVTGKDDAATSEIRARAAFLGQSAKTGAATVTHNGSGEGGGNLGRCPVVMRNTTVAVTDTAGGSKIVVTPRDAKEKDWLRTESRARLTEIAAAPGSDGAGAGKMGHCPNAVKGATTSIADGADAVKITVTAKDDASVKEIRERALKIIAASKNDAKTIKHDGNGDGGGGFGRCPVVLKDTAVDAKDAPGGSVFTVKPKAAKDLGALKTEVRARTAKFE